MATAAEIRNKAAKKLGLFGTGQTLRSAISDDLDDAYTEVYGELKALSLITWTATGTIPDEMVRPLVALVAAARANEYSVPDNKYQRVMADAVTAESTIREYVAQRKVGHTKIEAF